MHTHQLINAFPLDLLDEHIKYIIYDITKGFRHSTFIEHKGNFVLQANTDLNLKHDKIHKTCNKNM